MGPLTSMRSALVRAGLASPPVEPHQFEIAMHLLSHPASGPSVATVPHVVTPTESAHCARDGCGRGRSDPIHRIPDDRVPA
jgi:hypothetical protein